MIAYANILNFNERCKEAEKSSNDISFGLYQFEKTSDIQTVQKVKGSFRNIQETFKRAQLVNS